MDNHQDSEERPPPETDVQGKGEKKKKAAAKFVAYNNKRISYTDINTGTEGSLRNCFGG